MDDHGIIALSWLSKKCKNLVVSLEIEYILSASLTDHITIQLPHLRIEFYSEPDLEVIKKHLRTPPSVVFQHFPPRTYTWNNNTIGMKDWLDHLETIFHYPVLSGLTFLEGSFAFDIYSIKEVFGVFKDLRIDDTDCYDYNESIFKVFNTVKEIEIEFEVLAGLDNPYMVLIQNFDRLLIGWHFEDPSAFTLDDLVMINSRQINIEALHISFKELNKFLKLWMKGSNPQMEKLSISYVSDENTDVIMEGTNYQQGSLLRKRVFQSTGSKKIIYGGMDIIRIDGTMATIFIEDYDNDPEEDSYINMFVWHDHCVVHDLPEISFNL